MTSSWFKCTLKTDIALNQRAATEGSPETLDFIPGGNFLGIVANALYESLPSDESLAIFHSGKVRFGDAHPGKNGKRALRVPASFYKGKLKKMTDELYIYHAVEKPDAQDYKDFQPKQCRSGFYIFEKSAAELKFYEVQIERSFAIKSAYDPKERRSRDKAMFGYKSLRAGSEWFFEVSFDDDVSAQYATKVENALTGTKRIGRSRTAQYGLVQIDRFNGSPETDLGSKSYTDHALVYADARLIFLDEFGQPTFQPSAEDHLGFKNAEIDWEKSQIRTFQYAPWNAKRHNRDIDRCGIEKGSLIYVKKASADELEYPAASFVGSYKNEGFGKVIFNPDFLGTIPDSNGRSKYTFVPAPAALVAADRSNEDIGSKSPYLIKYLNARREKVFEANAVLIAVSQFVNDNESCFSDEAFASQWGAIRDLVEQYQEKDEFVKKLKEYLTRGVASDKWEEKGRLDKLMKLINEFKDRNFKSAIINLCGEMAKISGK